MSDELVHMMAKPEAMLNNAVSNFTKKAAATVWGKFKRQLSTASEPFLRKNMGERYLSRDALIGGAAIWFWATVAALAFSDIRSVGAFISYIPALHRLGHWMNNFVPTILVGGALSLFHFRFASENTRLMAKYRAESKPYHTQSRGVPRWEGNLVFMPLGIVAVLILFDLPAAILFVFSCIMSAKIASEQQEAIYARYLDALDARIEKEYLEDAILGKCPTEITQLHKPLPESLTADLRQNIAAAAVGKQVEILAQGPRIGGQADTPNVAANIPDRPQEAAPQAPRNPRAGAPIRAATQGFTPPSPKAQPSEAVESAPVEAAKPTQSVAAVAQPANQPPAATQTAVADSKYKMLFFSLIIVLAVGGATASVIHFWPAKTKALPAYVVTRSVTSPRVPAQAIPNPPPPAAPVVQPLQAQPVTAAPATDTVTVAQTDSQAQKLEERQQALEQITSELTNRIAQLAIYTADCEAKLDAYDGKLASSAPANRAVLKHRNDSARRTIENNLKNQAESLKGYQTVFGALLARPEADPQVAMQSITEYFAKMDRIHDEFTAIFARLDRDFAPDPH